MMLLTHKGTLSLMAQNIIDRIDSGSGPGVLRFFKVGETGGVPTSIDQALTDQVLLGVLTCSDPCATEEDGLIIFAPVTQEDGALAAANGTTDTLFVIAEASDGSRAHIFDVSNNAGDGMVKLNTTAIAEGGPIQISSLIVRVGKFQVS